MQTFLPYDNVIASVRCLDYRRLGNQRNEATIVYNSLLSGRGWHNHPAVRMWKGHENYLLYYRNECILEWIRRGYKNTMPIIDEIESATQTTNFNPPPWWGGRIHASHRAALLFKLPEWYQQFDWKEKPELNYFWPTKHA